MQRRIFLSILLLLLSLIPNHVAGLYATERISNPVTDIILSNIPIYDVDGLFIYGPFIFYLFVAALLLYKPDKIPFVLRSVSLFIVIRAIFVTLTHISPFPNYENINPLQIVWLFTTGNDLFFSGHTGLPFLLALIYWKNETLRFLFIGISVFFAIIALLGHFHYSIDVFAAYFITYTIYHLAEVTFSQDLLIFERGSQ